MAASVLTVAVSRYSVSQLVDQIAVEAGSSGSVKLGWMVTVARVAVVVVVVGHGAGFGWSLVLSRAGVARLVRGWSLKDDRMVQVLSGGRRKAVQSQEKREKINVPV